MAIENFESINSLASIMEVIEDVIYDKLPREYRNTTAGRLPLEAFAYVLSSLDLNPREVIGSFPMQERLKKTSWLSLAYIAQQVDENGEITPEGEKNIDDYFKLRKDGIDRWNRIIKTERHIQLFGAVEERVEETENLLRERKQIEWWMKKHGRRANHLVIAIPNELDFVDQFSSTEEGESFIPSNEDWNASVALAKAQGLEIELDGWWVGEIVESSSEQIEFRLFDEPVKWHPEATWCGHLWRRIPREALEGDT